LLEKLTVVLITDKLLCFMEHEDSTSCSRGPSSSPCPVAHEVSFNSSNSKNRSTRNYIVVKIIIYLFMCRVNIYKANYRHGTVELYNNNNNKNRSNKSTTKHKITSNFLNGVSLIYCVRFESRL
jgi:hypothetical protein